MSKNSIGAKFYEIIQFILINTIFVPTLDNYIVETFMGLDVEPILLP